MCLENQPDAGIRTKPERIPRLRRNMHFERGTAIDLQHAHHIALLDRDDPTREHVPGAQALRYSRGNENIASTNGNASGRANLGSRGQGHLKMKFRLS